MEFYWRLKKLEDAIADENGEYDIDWLAALVEAKREGRTVEYPKSPVKEGDTVYTTGNGEITKRKVTEVARAGNMGDIWDDTIIPRGRIAGKEAGKRGPGDATIGSWRRDGVKYMERDKKDYIRLNYGKLTAAACGHIGYKAGGR
jgi:hypothetical protein